MKFDLYQREGVLYYVLVYPEKRLAKIYLNKPEGYRKLGDECSANFTFNLSEFDLAIDFSLIWR